MAARIDDGFMTAEHGGRVIVTGRYCEHAPDDGRGVWDVYGLPGRLFIRNQAITAMVLVERLARVEASSLTAAAALVWTIDLPRPPAA
jgi:hypothetical protein